MPYVIAAPCEGVKDATCVEVCPVECIFTTEDSLQYYIDPEICIECEQCVFVCPVEAISLDRELPEEWKVYIERNAEFYQKKKEGIMAVSFEHAVRMIQAAHEKAAELPIAVTAAVVDEAGRIIAVGRMDKARPMTVELAVGKAYTSSSFQMPTHDLATMAQQQQFLNFFTPLTISTGGQMIAVGGGLPILLNGAAVIGAMGVSGGTPEQDVECCRAGLAAATS